MKLDLRKFILLMFLSRSLFANLIPRTISRPKTHRYFESNSGKDFFIDSFKSRLGLYTMTSQRSSVKPKDHILIEGQSQRRLFTVLEIEYYSGLSDLWVAKLATKVSSIHRRYISFNRPRRAFKVQRSPGRH
jgi:hypothetical protein